METTKKLLAFIEAAKSPFHAVETARQAVEAAGFTQLHEGAIWAVKPGGKYYVTRNLSSMLAFTVPQTGFGPMLIAASHCDSPAYKLKETFETVVQNQYVRANVEGYGGINCAPWMDRPLSVAGRVVVKTATGVTTRLMAIDRDLLVIPNMPLHLNRGANDGYKYNAAIDMQPLLGTGAEKGVMKKLIAQELDVAQEDILSSDLFLYVRQKGTVFGAQQEFALAPRMDDLGCAFGTLEGFLQADPKMISVWAMFDNEEVGSSTKQGACSTFLADTLQRLCTALGCTREDYLAALPASMMLSADNGHALHPNHTEIADAACPVYLNGGVVLKCAANQKYTTDAVSSALFQTICARAEVPVQLYFDRADMLGGSTLGNLSDQRVSINTVDIGLPQLAMHSACETFGVKDTAYMVRAVKEFYSATLTCAQDGTYAI